MTQQLDPLIIALVGAFNEHGPDGPELAAPLVPAWSDKLAAHQDPEQLAPQLVVIALRFHRAGAIRACEQIVDFVVPLIGADDASKQLAAAGLPTGITRRIASAGRGVSSPLAGGLAPPGKKTKL